MSWLRALGITTLVIHLLGVCALYAGRDVQRYNRVDETNASMLVLAWQRYSGSTGNPSVDRFYQGATAAWNWLIEIGYWPRDVGGEVHSTGSGSALQLARNTPPNVSILEAPHYRQVDGSDHNNLVRDVLYETVVWTFLKP